MLTLVPAYGRDYKSITEANAAWHSNCDFLIASIGPHTGSYINKSDAIKYGISVVTIRYDKREKSFLQQVG